MILREMMLDSLQGMSLPVQGTAPAADENSKGGKPVFGDILSNTVKANKKSEVTSDEPSTRSRPKAASETPENKSAVKTFRELQNEIRHEARKTEVKTKVETAADTSIADNTPVKDSDKEISNDELDKVINCFAQALGLNPGEFRQLLKAADIAPEELAADIAPEELAADIAPEELAAVTDVKQLTSKLSEVLGLNADHSKTLGDLLELVKAQVQAAVKPEAPKVQSVETKPENAPTDMVNLAKTTKDTPEIEVVRVQGNPDAEFSALMVKMKLKLNEMQDKMNNNKEGLIEEISLKLQVMLKEVDDSSDTKAESKTVADTDGIETAEMGKTAVKTDDKQNSADTADTKEGKSQSKTDDSRVKPAIEAVVSAVNEDQPQMTAPITAPITAPMQKAGEVSQMEKLDVRTPVQTREIINQVLEKAKVILTGDKSEMVMDLKPDSLGKLSLKVVTEHGMVMAKFVAENQQVKQVLETNMQLLKDSLEKQGMSVQGFSVSVREDSQQGYRGQNETGSQKRAVLHGTAFNTEKLMISAERIATIERRNPYRWGTSTVNFTA